MPLVFSAAFGALLGMGLLKFGNPVILDHLVAAPANAIEFMVQPWPLKWGYVLLAVVVAASIPLLKFQATAPKWAIFLPVIWYGWQWLASARTIDAVLTRATLGHFTACLICYFLGLFALKRCPRAPFAAAVTVGLLLVLWSGLEQHYGGLEATRRMVYEQPDWQKYPKEYLLKLASNRIFATLVYPNALAGGILLLLPLAAWTLWSLTGKLPPLSRRVVTGLAIYTGLACLYWSGSKAGWLIALMLALVMLLHAGLDRRLKWTLLAVALAGGLTAFFIKFAPYFQKGATSVSARFEYWKAAAITTRENPILGTGPGTFSKSYQKIKPPEAEMTKLTHNDYLEQACDSGLIGFLSYSAFIVGSIAVLRRKALQDPSRLAFAVWLGLLAWAAQGLVEFSLYIPALSWCGFALLGWLWGASENESTAKPA